jgi:hypothetical protein
MLTARLRPNTPANPVAALEHNHVAVAQIPRGAQSGDASSDHDDVVLLQFHEISVVGIELCFGV